MSNIKTLIQPSIDFLTPHRRYAIDFGKQIVTACDIMGLKSEDVIEVLPYHSGGGYIHLFMKINSDQVLVFNYLTDGILLTYDAQTLNADFIDVFFGEGYFADYYETELSDPNPDFITSNLLK